MRRNLNSLLQPPFCGPASSEHFLLSPSVGFPHSFLALGHLAYCSSEMMKQNSLLYLTDNFRTGHLADISQNIFKSNSGVSRSSAAGYGCTTRRRPPAPFHPSYATASKSYSEFKLILPLQTPTSTRLCTSHKDIGS